MKNYWKQLLVLALIALSGYYLYPTIQFYGLSPEQREALRQNNPTQFYDQHKDAINLGLDLQGGIYLVLEVDLSQLPPDQAQDAVQRALEIIRNRVDQFGVAEPSIQREGANRIIVELPGIQDIERAKSLVGQTALLEFQMVEPAAERDHLLQRLSTVLGGTTAADSAGQKPEDQSLFGEDQPKPEAAQGAALLSLLSSYGGEVVVASREMPRVRAMLESRRGAEATPGDVEFLFSSKPEGPPGNQFYRLQLVRKRPEMTGAVIKDAQVSVGQSVEYMGQPIVEFATTDEGANTLRRVTGAHIDERMAIVLDGTVYSAPTIQSKIPNGRGIITGSGTQEEAKDLAIVLRAGALPAEVEIIEDRTVGPSLGRDSVEQGKTAFLIATVLVALFMILYYRFVGLVADIALTLNIFFLLGILAYFHATLTLPGLAGIVLTVGMAVDTNVLIFERIREELRAGRTVRAGIDSGYAHAMSAIVDSNVTTLIAGIVLYQFGTGPIRGFALTLCVGIITSLFTGIFVTRAIFDAFTRNPKATTLSIGPINALAGLKIPFMRWRKVAAWGFSALLLLVGLVSIGGINGLKTGIDFSGGTVLELHFDPPVSVDQVRGQLGGVQVGNRSLDLSSTEIKQFGSPSNLLLRISEGESGTEVADALKSTLKTAFAGSIENEQDWVRRQEKVGPKIGKELSLNAVRAVLTSLVLTMLYLAVRFRVQKDRVGPHGLTWGAGAVLATFHDVLITLGIISLFSIELSLGVVAALLTIVGYSLNDTIVVFDRIREMLQGRGRESFFTRDNFIELLNLSVNQTFSRTTITGMTTLMSLIVLMIWGGEVNRDFVTVLLFGLVVGTYSSIFVASPILLVLSKFEEAKQSRRP
ncbi:MAG: protein translocase subunit SecD [Candidatus Latescibacteria bacterium]|nr:protein translocase subunit SecD [Candidatus Latescibacterota bacterium]